MIFFWSNVRNLRKSFPFFNSFRLFSACNMEVDTDDEDTSSFLLKNFEALLLTEVQLELFTNLKVRQLSDGLLDKLSTDEEKKLSSLEQLERVQDFVARANKYGSGRGVCVWLSDQPKIKNSQRKIWELLFPR